MPIYEYTCPKCHHKREQFRPLNFRDGQLMCPVCGADMRRVGVPEPTRPKNPHDDNPRLRVPDVFRKV